MPHTDTQPPLPFRAGSQTSYKAALNAAPRAIRKRDQLWELYETHGALSDPEVEQLTGWCRSSICSLRNGLKDRLVKDGTSTSKWGQICDRWRIAG